MTDKRKSQKAGAARKGSSKQTGKSINPADLPDTDASPSPGKRRYIPIGRPMSPERYKKIKKEVGKETPPGADTGQKDPST